MSVRLEALAGRERPAVNRIGLVASVLAASCLPIACSPSAQPPPGISGHTTNPILIKGWITAVAPDAEFRGGGQSGGGDAYHLHLDLGTSASIGDVIRSIRDGVSGELDRLGATVFGRGGGETRIEHPEKRTIRTSESVSFRLRGYRGHLFLDVFPIHEEPRRAPRYQVILRGVEFYVSQP